MFPREGAAAGREFPTMRSSRFNCERAGAHAKNESASAALRKRISREGEVYTVTGGTVEYILDTTDADDEESMRRFQRMLKAEGIIDALREAGAGNESIVRMGEWEFDFIE